MSLSALGLLKCHNGALGLRVQGGRRFLSRGRLPYARVTYRGFVFIAGGGAKAIFYLLKGE